MIRQRDALPFFYRPWSGSQGIMTRVGARKLAFLIALLIIIALAIWLYLRMASEVAHYAHEIRELEREKERLHRQITVLRAEVAMLGSADRIYRAGQEMGYVLPEASDVTRRTRIEYQPPQALFDQAGASKAAAAGSKTMIEPATGVAGIWRQLVGQFEAWIGAP